MCNTIESDKTEGKEEKRMPMTSQVRMVAVALAIAIGLAGFVVAVLLPLIQETQIHVVIANDRIDNAWVETPSVTAISKLFSPSKKVGIYAISIKISDTNETFEIADVPAGVYAVIWKSGFGEEGLPSSGSYTIKITLRKQGNLVHEFTLPVTF